ncbi:MAG: SDR family NAD(P)-dependent oxidoreductase, partial [Promethearchaeota archaeon]
MMDKFLEGKGALITGGASGFGRGVAYAYAERGADLVLVDVNEELLIETSKNVEKKTGKKVISIVCDVSNSDQVEAMVKQV